VYDGIDGDNGGDSGDNKKQGRNSEMIVGFNIKHMK
jgi:hypothetical protein